MNITEKLLTYIGFGTLGFGILLACASIGTGNETIKSVVNGLIIFSGIPLIFALISLALRSHLMEDENV